MSSKFFTWTKGDRRSAAEALRAGGIVPIPAECIKIKGMEYARAEKGSHKSNRKPAPLTLEDTGSTVSTPQHSSRTNDSIALHEAAVRSATSLMTVMNDMLRTPQLSAHFSQSQNIGLIPLPGRARSHTAPSTPLAEAPVTEPVELPGSLPDDRKHRATVHQPIHRIKDILLESPAALGTKIVRSRSSPQEATHTIPSRMRMSVESFYRDSDFNPLSQLSPRSKSTSPTPETLAQRQHNSEMPQESTDDTTPGATRITRPQLSVLPNEPPQSSATSISLPVSQHGSLESLPRLSSLQTETTSSQADNLHRIDVEAMLIAQISNMRASHEAHLTSLKEAHAKELASQRTYIDFLEKRRGISTGAKSGDRHAMLVDTPNSETLVGDTLFSDDSTTTLESLETHGNDQKYTYNDGRSGLEALKRKTSLYRKAQVDANEVRRERDQLREAAERSQRRILQLKDIVRKAKDNEKALRNTNADLQARLVTANNERTDVLEGFHDACDKVRSLSEREKVLLQDFEVAKANADQYNSLLHAELRRQSRHATHRGHPSSEVEVSAIAAEKSHRLKLTAESAASSNLIPEQGCNNRLSSDVLEKELDYCIAEVISYKKDVRAYKKDLKKANAKIEDFQAATVARHHSLENSMSSTTRGHSDADMRSEPSADRNERSLGIPDPAQVGLGLRLPPSPADTPAKRIAAATSASLLAAAPPSTSSTMSSPPLTRPRTPLGAHKKLPKPPPSPIPRPFSSSTRPNARVQRTKTIRSLSESIISSYAKRTTPDVASDNFAPPMNQESEAQQAVDTWTSPVSRYDLRQTAVSDIAVVETQQ